MIFTEGPKPKSCAGQATAFKRGCTRKSTVHVALGVTDLREICTSDGARSKNSPRELFLEFGGRTVALGPILG